MDEDQERTPLSSLVGQTIGEIAFLPNKGDWLIIRNADGVDLLQVRTDDLFDKEGNYFEVDI